MLNKASWLYLHLALWNFLFDSSFATECRPSDDGLGTYCTCIPGYYGPSCERCVSRCKVDVHCDWKGTYCTCIPGYYGPSCERCVSRCKIDVHRDWKGTYCTCVPGYCGPSCKRCVSRCKVDVHDDRKGTYCTCISGWYGPSCEKCVWHCKIDVKHDWKGLFAPIKSTHLLWPWLIMKSSIVGLCVMVDSIKVREAVKPGWKEKIPPLLFTPWLLSVTNFVIVKQMSKKIKKNKKMD